MKQQLDKNDFARMFHEAAIRLRSQNAFLTELDSVAGDGDHGTTMMRVAEQLEAAKTETGQQSLKMLFKNTGWSLLGIDGGASSAILGTFFTGMADADVCDEINCHELASVFEAGLRALAKQTKAAPGDKTMMDALVPAVDAVRSAANSGKTIVEALNEAAVAACSGAASTKALAAKYGRAKFLGERTLGHADAGATSVALIFSGFSAAINCERSN
jgi:dihydroxyacetone kinase-like protein